MLTMDELPFKVRDLMDGDDYKQFARNLNEMRPEIYAIEDEVQRLYLVSLYHATKFSPIKDIYLKSSLRPENSKCYERLRNEMEICRGREEEIGSLPIEDTVWFIDHFVTHGPDENGDIVRYLIMIDKKTIPVAFNIADPRDMSFQQQAYELVCLSALYPLIYNPRRPLYVTFKDPVKAQKINLDLSKLGIVYLFLGGPKLENDRLSNCIRMRECNFCHFKAAKDFFQRCSSCQAIIYCSKQCQRKDWDMPGEMQAYSHKNWCHKMKNYMDKMNELKQLPFEFTEETISDEFDVWKYKEFLERNGIYNEGLWRRECTLWLKPGMLMPFGKLPITDNPYVLPVESSILEDSPKPSQDIVIKDWESYYRFRGFRMDSPIAILMQFPLTLYYIITKCLPIDYQSWWDTVDTNEINVDIVGVEKEVEMLQVFQEVGNLLPDNHIDIHMFGREISKAVDGTVKDLKNMKITVHKKVYHSSTDHRKPHLIVGFNAGLEAYRTWMDTAKKIKDEKIPAYFTDYCQHSIAVAQIGLQQHCALEISNPIINPFRSPVRKLCEEHDMPWFSNAFLFHFIY